MTPPKSDTALILIDIQKGMDELDFFGTERNNLQAEENCKQILERFRVLKWPVYHVKHNSTNPESPLFPGKPGNEIKNMVRPIGNEPLIEKAVNSAFIGTNLQGRLDAAGIKKIIIVGLTTDHCVSTSTRMAGNLGYETILVSDATATFGKTGINGEKYSAETMHLVNLASLNEEFADVITTEEVMGRL